MIGLSGYSTCADLKEGGKIGNSPLSALLQLINIPHRQVILRRVFVGIVMDILMD